MPCRGALDTGEPPSRRTSSAEESSGAPILRLAARALIALMPRDFRDGFGDDMALAFEEAVSATRAGKGRGAALLRGLVMLADLGVTVVAERHAALVHRVGGTATAALEAVVGGGVVASLCLLAPSTPIRIVIVTAIAALAGLALSGRRLWWILLAPLAALGVEVWLALARAGEASLPSGGERFSLHPPGLAPGWLLLELSGILVVGAVVGMAIGRLVHRAIARSETIAAVRFPFPATRRDSG